MKKVQEYFKNYPGSKAVHQTSDGFLFPEKCDAQNHAKTLKDATVVTHQRTAAKATPAQDEEDVIADPELPAAPEAAETPEAPAGSEAPVFPPDRIEKGKKTAKK